MLEKRSKDQTIQDEISAITPLLELSIAIILDPSLLEGVVLEGQNKGILLKEISQGKFPSAEALKKRVMELSNAKK